MTWPQHPSRLLQHVVTAVLDAVDHGDDVEGFVPVRELSHVTAMQCRARRPKACHVQERLGGIDPVTDSTTGLGPLQSQTRPAGQVEELHTRTYPRELLEHIERVGVQRLLEQRPIPGLRAPRVPGVHPTHRFDPHVLDRQPVTVPIRNLRGPDALRHVPVVCASNVAIPVGCSAWRRAAQTDIVRNRAGTTGQALARSGAESLARTC